MGVRDILREKNKKKEAQTPQKKSVIDILREKTTAFNNTQKSSIDFFQKGAFDDGIDLQDFIAAPLASSADLKMNVVKGAGGLVEGLTDLAGYGVAGVADLFGADEWADNARNKLSESWVDNLLKPAEDFLDDYSVWGRTTDSVAQGLGQVGTILATGGIAAGAGLGTAATTALTTGTMGLSGVGSGIGEAYQSGATDGEAFTYGLISGAADAATELLFGGLSKGVKAVGISSGLGGVDDMVIKGLTSKINNTLTKNIAQAGLKAGGEGLEEVLAGFAQAWGKSITYKSEEELSDIIKDENLLEQFVVGALTSGISQAGDVVRTTKSGQDFITGYTDNEQKVYDKYYDKLVEEKEANGNKLTSKEKNDLYESVKTMMEKGYIPTDIIAEVVGGDEFTAYKSAREGFSSTDDYKSYKDAITEENALMEEYNDLKKKIEGGDRSSDNLRRFNDLVSRKNELSKSTLKGDLKTKLDAEHKRIGEMGEKLHTNVYNQVKDTRLAESYRENARRGQDFEADLNQYDEKQRAVVQKAIDSGILNNTRKTHEFVDLIAKIAADKDVPFDFTNNKKLKESGFAIDGKTINGFVTADGVTININSEKALNSVVGHEIAHVMEGTDLYDAMQKALFDYAKAKGEYDSRLKKLTEVYKDVKDADVTEELTADLVGDYLFTDPDFINNLAKTDRNMFQKIFDEIKYMLKVATAGSKEARELEKVKHYFQKAYNENIKGKPETEQKNTAEDSGVKYSIVETVDGRFVAVIDNDILSDIDTTSWDDTKKDAAKEAAVNALKEFKGGIVVDGVTRKVNRISRKEYTRSKYTEKLYGTAPNVFADKMRAAEVADDIVVAATNWSRDGGLKHHRNDKFVDFDHGNTLIMSGNAKYEAEVVVGITKTGEAVFYDVVDMEPSTFDIKKEEAPPTATTQDAPGSTYVASSADNVAQEEPDVKPKYSVSDSDGNQLTQEQQDYFKDSKVVDENGSLKVMYHGTPNGNFTVFKDGTYFTDNKEYADRYQNPGASSISTGKTATNPKTFEVYLDIKKPFDLNDAEARDIYINEYIKGGNAVGINPYLSDAEYDKIKTIDWTEGEDLRDFLIENGYDYDGLVLDEGAEGGYGDEVKNRGTSYVVFSPEQVKNSDNKTPTADPDIRFSLSDANAEQKQYGSYNVYGKDIALEAPIQDDIAPIAEETVVEDAPIAAPDEELAEMFPDDLLPLQGELSSLLEEKNVLENRLREVTQRLSSPDATEQDVADFQQVSGKYDALMKRVAELEQETGSNYTERFDGLLDEDAHLEIERVDNTPADTVSLSKKNITDIAREVKDALGLNNKQMYDVHKLIEDYSKNEFPSREKLFQDIKETLGTYTEKYKDQGTADAQKELRTSRLYVDDIIRGEIADFNDLRKRNRGKIRFSRSGIPVDVKYAEWSEAYPYLFPKSIINPTDQFLRIVEVANMDSTATNEQPIDDATLLGVTDDIIEYVSDIKQLQKETDANRESREAFDSLMKDADKYVPFDDIAPTPASVAKEAPMKESVAPTAEKSAAEATAVDKPIKTVKERLSAKLENFQTELAENQRLRQASWSDYDQEIARLQEDYDARKNKATVGANDILRRIERLKRMQGNVDADYAKRISDLEANTAKVSEEIRTGESSTEQGAMRKELHTRIVDDIKTNFAENGLDFDKVLKEAKDLSTFATVDNAPQRVMEKSLGYKAGQVLSDMTVNKVAQNETEGVKWLNSFTDRKNGLLKKISEKYNIKPGSKESAAAQMYAEGFYVNDQNEIIQYGDAELAKDFPDAGVQARIKGLAKDPRIRKIYDETLAMINESRARNAYPEIQKLDNYFLHFRAMDDTFSRLGLPFNPNDIKAKDLPTDLNGVTADLKPGQPYFASAMHRKGKRTSFDLLGGLERYLTSAKDQIYHIDDIQTLRALRNYIADTYGQAKGLEDLDLLTEEEAQAKIKDVYDSHLSTFAKFLNEEANVIAGKTSLIDRGLEGIIGRRGITFLNTINQQVGKNMVGFNVSSSLTNILPVVQTFAKTNKADFVKAFAQTASNKIGSINGKSDGFAEASPVIIRRKGADSFYRTPYQKIGDAGYVLMGAIDNVSTELIARTKYNELVRKGMDTEQAHIETDKWVSRLMGDRSLGQQPQLYNSKMLGLITKFQLEVRNQLDSQFYDTIQEANASTENIENGLATNAKKAAKIASTFVQLAVLQHLFGKAFESVAGYNPAFDIIEVLIKALGWDDDEEDEDTAIDNLEEGFLALLEDLPYTSTFTGGRIPIESALPIEQFVTGKDDYGNDKSRWKTLGEALPYYLLPGGYGQIKKTKAGWDMFSDEHPISGSYTDNGNLRFPVEDTPLNRAQAAVFGQYASKNARDYFDNDWAPLNEKQIQEFIDVDIPIQDYRAYREGLKGKNTAGEKIAYIAGLDLPLDKKNLLANNLLDRKEPIDLADWYANDGLEEFDYAKKYPEKAMFLEANGISMEEYNEFDEDTKSAYTWAYQNPGKFTMSKVVANDLMEYRLYTSDLNNIEADKDKHGNSISGSVKEKRIDYINGLDLDYGQKIILYRSMYNSAEDRRLYNAAIVEYLNSRTDLSYEDIVAILKELDFTVYDDGTVRWN